MAARAEKIFDLWLVGWGNPMRRDDGVGHFLVRELAERLSGQPGLRVRTLAQLDPGRLEDLKDADLVIVADAGTEELAEGWSCFAVTPRDAVPPCLSHDFRLPFLLWVMEAAFQRCPPVWLLVVQGMDFRAGEGLSARAQGRALAALPQMESRILTKSVDKAAASIESCRWAGRTQDCEGV